MRGRRAAGDGSWLPADKVGGGAARPRGRLGAQVAVSGAPLASASWAQPRWEQLLGHQALRPTWKWTPAPPQASPAVSMLLRLAAPQAQLWDVLSLHPTCPSDNAVLFSVLHKAGHSSSRLPMAALPMAALTADPPPGPQTGSKLGSPLLRFSPHSRAICPRRLLLHRAPCPAPMALQSRVGRLKIDLQAAGSLGQAAGTHSRQPRRPPWPEEHVLSF